MELSNTFEVKAPIEEAWTKLTDLDLIAPAMPGAQLDEVEGDEYRGTMKVKVGPITAKYKGTAKVVDKDADAKLVMIDAKGSDTRGQGSAAAVITAQLTEAGVDATKVELVTDLTLTGRVAQFARGVLSDVSTKLIGQFVDNLESDVFSSGEAPKSVTPSAKSSSDESGSAKAASTKAASASAAPDKTAAKKAGSAKPAVETTSDEKASDTVATEKSSETKDAGEVSAVRQVGGPAAPSSGVRRVTSPEAEAVDLLDATGAPLAKRVLPALGLLAIVLLIIRLLRNRSSD